MISHRLMEKDSSVAKIVPDQHYTSLPSLPQILPGRSRNGVVDVGGNQTHTNSYSLGPLYEKPYGSAKNKSLLVSQQISKQKELIHLCQRHLNVDHNLARNFKSRISSKDDAIEVYKTPTKLESKKELKKVKIFESSSSFYSVDTSVKKPNQAPILVSKIEEPSDVYQQQDSKRSLS